MSSLRARSLLHFEQRVNDRDRTSKAPAIDSELLPEAGKRRPLAWRRIPAGQLEVFHTSDELAREALAQLRGGEDILVPVHPLSEYRFEQEGLLYAGFMQVSASYRTIFYEPEAGGPFHGWVPPGQALSIKLHLDEPLPGIPGDRRLTRDKVEKCVLLSTALPNAVANDPLADRLRILPEFLGLSHPDGGVLFRLVPDAGAFPAFSLHSRDQTAPGEPPLIIAALDALHPDARDAAAEDIGPQLAAPLVRSLLAAMRAGFSLEMHAQNTLLQPGRQRLIDAVLFRDLEGVVFSNRFRRSNGQEPLFADSKNEELIWPGRSMARWYNRNLDHDIGRILSATLEVLSSTGYFSDINIQIARQSIRHSVREAVRESGLSGLHWPGRLMGFSRSPYGNGLRLGDYYRTRYR